MASGPGDARRQPRLFFWTVEMALPNEIVHRPDECVAGRDDLTVACCYAAVGEGCCPLCLHEGRSPGLMGARVPVPLTLRGPEVLRTFAACSCGMHWLLADDLADLPRLASYPPCRPRDRSSG